MALPFVEVPVTEIEVFLADMVAELFAISSPAAMLLPVPTASVVSETLNVSPAISRPSARSSKVKI